MKIPFSASFALFLTAALTLSPSQTAPAQTPEEPPVPRAVPVDLKDKNGNYAPLPEDLESQLRLQIYLDGKNFGPGYLDGKIGEFGKKAASVYNQLHDIPVGNYHQLIDVSQKAAPNLYTTYTLKAEDLKFVTPGLSAKPALQAKAKYMGYRSAAEFVSERFHTSEDFLAKINPSVKIYSLKPGDVLNVPNVTPFELEKWPQHQQFKEEVPMNANAVVVDIRARVAIFFDENNKPVASFPITPGRPKFIQFGEWKVSNMVTTPEFRWDKSMLENGKRSSDFYELPIGPNSPVGIMWCGTTRNGIGLHGTATPHSIGRGESAGCIRLANWDAARLPTLLRPGARVVIR